MKTIFKNENKTYIFVNYASTELLRLTWLTREYV